jgi:hypothetical protein
MSHPFGQDQIHKSLSPHVPKFKLPALDRYLIEGTEVGVSVHGWRVAPENATHGIMNRLSITAVRLRN